jgi:hypothetical protein
MRNRLREEAMGILRMVFICIIVSIPAFAQTYDIVIRGWSDLDHET